MPDTHVKFHSSNGKRRILIIEEKEGQRQFLEQILEATYDITFITTGREAIELLERDYDTLSLILLDLDLPDLHDLAFLRRIKGDFRWMNLPVIVMTEDKDAEVGSLTLGASDFIPKPFPVPTVIRARILRTIELSEDRDIIRLTERDRLTGLYNREYFYRYASQFDLYHKEMDMDAIVLDINHFHMINERHGKKYGDMVLAQIGEKVRDIVKDSGGIVCRREADTFLVYCPHRSDYARILEDSSVFLSRDGKKESRVRIRMGVYSNVDKSIDIERRFDRAKQAADQVKNNFTRTIAIYDNSLHEAELFAEQLVEDFHQAIEEGQFRVYYQPKFNIRDQEPILCSAEALVRWHHPRLGILHPEVFIPLFEKNGLIQELDHIVWREAAAQLAEWKRRHKIQIPLSLNVSRVDMYDLDIVEVLGQLIQDYGLEKRDLMLEITETAYAEDSEQIVEVVKLLREIGYLIEMDDFGTGYSSLNMLSSLPIDVLKLDMDFIRQAFKDRKDTRLLKFVLDLADSLGVPTIAEGVETAEQVLTLKGLGCDIVQGYYFSGPLPAPEFEEYMMKQMMTDKWTVLEITKTGRKRIRNKHTYDALHDPLTGLYNNSAFEIFYQDSDKEHIAVLIIEVDQYAALRESDDKELADRVICKVAKVLKGHFRSVDDICRLSEDEFVVIMTRVNSTLKALVFDKIERMNHILLNPDDGLAPLSLSVGVAFSDRDKPEGDVFQDADTALYRMKEVRRCGCAVY